MATNHTFVKKKESMSSGYIYASLDVWPATNLLKLKGGLHELILFCRLVDIINV